MSRIPTSFRTGATLALTATLLALAACGGGGGSAPPAGTPQSVPTSGTYSWLLKAQGSTSALRKGLSLVHPAAPSVEFVVEPASAAVTDALTLPTGAVDPIGLTTQALQAYALLYIVGGDVRMVPLDADGTGPVTRVQRAGSSSACAFVLSAIDHAHPLNSRFIVSTAGADGLCSSSADNGNAEVLLSASGPSLVPISGAPPLDLVRDSTTLAPRGWLYATVVKAWADGSTTALQAPLTAVIASTVAAALVDNGAQLAVLGLGSAGSVTTTLLDAVATAGGGWQSIGYDASNFYVYRNSLNCAALALDQRPACVAASNWTVLRIGRTAPLANELTRGAGYLSVASMGRSLLYLTTLGAAGNQLLSIGKTASGAAPTVIESTASSTLTTVQTSAGTVHQLWRVSNLGGPSLAYAIEMIDEAGRTLYTSGAGGFAMTLQEAQVQRFDVSESRTRYVFATGYGARAYGDARLVAYDATTATATTIGTLPGSAAYGNDFVFANVQAGPAAFVAAYAARSSGGVVQDGGSDVFSFDIGRADSIVHTTVRQ